jgi:hypothetical protein
MVSVNDEDIFCYSALNECNRHPRYLFITILNAKY